MKWSWKGDGPGYGSPVVADIGGTRQIITITQGKLVGVDASTGALLWERPFVITNMTNSVTPVVHGRTIIVSGNGEPTRALAIAKRANQWVTDIVWENADIPLRMSDAVVVGDVLFGLANRNSGQYFAVDAKTGKTLWTSEGRQAAHAAIARSGDLLPQPRGRWRAGGGAEQQDGLRAAASLQGRRRGHLDAGGVFRQSGLRQGRLDPGALDAELRPVYAVE